MIRRSCEETGRTETGQLGILVESDHLGDKKINGSLFECLS
jgi:hypothetical protein